MQGGRTHLTTRNLAGTNGYIDPLYADSGQYSQTTDAYAMGVTLLVALSGRRALQAKDAADDALEDLTDGAALQRALDPVAGWPEPAARELLGIVKALTSGGSSVACLSRALSRRSSGCARTRACAQAWPSRQSLACASSAWTRRGRRASALAATRSAARHARRRSLVAAVAPHAAHTAARLSLGW